MAKKTKTRATKPRLDRPAKPSEVMKVPSEPRLKTLLRACKGADADRNEASGRKGSLIAAAIEKDHLDKKAWAVAASLERMSQQKGAITWAHLQHYVEALGLQKRFDEQQEMFARPELGEGEGETVAPATAPAPAARPGSFAAKMKEQEQARTATLVDPKKTPTPAEIKDIADRAEGRTAH